VIPLVYNVLVNLANDFIKKGDKSSLIAAYKILSTVYDSHQDKFILAIESDVEPQAGPKAKL